MQHLQNQPPTTIRVIKNVFRSGDVISMVVPENVVVVLPCHPSSANAPSQFGSQYLRKCENRAVGIAKTRQILR